MDCWQPKFPRDSKTQAFQKGQQVFLLCWCWLSSLFMSKCSMFIPFSSNLSNIGFLSFSDILSESTNRGPSHKKNQLGNYVVLLLFFCVAGRPIANHGVDSLGKTIQRHFLSSTHCACGVCIPELCIAGRNPFFDAGACPSTRLCSYKSVACCDFAQAMLVSFSITYEDLCFGMILQIRCNLRGRFASKRTWLATNWSCRQLTECRIHQNDRCSSCTCFCPWGSLLVYMVGFPRLHCRLTLLKIFFGGYWIWLCTANLDFLPQRNCEKEAFQKMEGPGTAWSKSLVPMGKNPSKKLGKQFLHQMGRVSQRIVWGKLCNKTVIGPRRNEKQFLSAPPNKCLLLAASRVMFLRWCKRFILFNPHHITCAFLLRSFLSHAALLYYALCFLNLFHFMLFYLALHYFCSTLVQSTALYSVFILFRICSSPKVIHF